MTAWVTAVQLLLVLALAGAVDEKESFDSYFQNFFQRHQEKVPRAISNPAPQNTKAVPARKQPSGRVLTPSLQTYNYQVAAAPAPRYILPQAVQYKQLQPPAPKYTTAYVTQVRTPSYAPEAGGLKFRPEDAIKSFNYNKEEQEQRQYSSSKKPSYQKPEEYRYNKEEQYSSSKKPSYQKPDEYHYKGSDEGYHEHVKVKSTHTHKKQTTGGTEDYFDGDYGDYDSKRGYRSLAGI